MIFAPTFSDLVLYEHPYWRSPCNTGRPSCSTARVYLSPQQQAMVDKVEKSQSNKEEATLLYQGHSVEISQDENNFYLSIDLPGVRQDDIQVNLLDSGILKVEAKRKSQNHTVAKQFALDETAIDKTNIQANLADGVLAIVVPKKEQKEEVSEPSVLVIPVTPDRFEGDKSSSSPKTTIVYTVDIPGVAAKNAKVTFYKDKLLLQAERRRGQETVSKTRRCLQVDAKRIDTTQFKAFLADGVLSIVASERQVPPPVRIVVVGTKHVPDSGETDGLVVETISDNKAADQPVDSEGKAAVMAVETVGVEEAAADEETSNSDSSSNNPEENVDWEEVNSAVKKN